MGKVFAISDLHGMYDLWKQVQETLQSDDILYMLGDAADRGPDGWKIIKEALGDPRVRYAHGHKICIDAGAFATGKVAILDLDTLQDLTIEIAK